MQKTTEKTLPPAKKASASFHYDEHRKMIRKASVLNFFGKFRRMNENETSAFLRAAAEKNERANQHLLAGDCRARLAELAGEPAEKEHNYVSAYLHFEKGGEHALAMKYAKEAEVVLAAQGKEFEKHGSWLAAAQAFAKITHLVKGAGEKAKYHDEAYQNFSRAEETLMAAKQAHAAFGELKSAREEGFKGEAASDFWLHLWAERAGRNYWNAHDKIDVMAAPDKEEAKRERAHLMELVRRTGRDAFMYRPREPQTYTYRGGPLSE